MFTHISLLDTPAASNSYSYTAKDYTPEVRTLIRDLRKAGFSIHSVSDGEERLKYDGHNLGKLVEHVTACDEGWLYVGKPDSSKRASLYLVFGNDSGELVNDYADWPELAAVVDAHASRWEGRPVPLVTKTLNHR
jgi:hypothetical protein